MSTALLLVNLGTPRSPSVDDVRTYLREFLGDPDVITLPAPVRWLLLEGVILRTRPKKSAAAYRSIWTDRGSPLMFHSEDLTARVAELLPATTMTALAMRYAEPSMASVVQRLHEQKINRICLFPLYPQFARASTKTVVNKLHKEMARLNYQAEVDVVPAFYDDVGFIDAFAENGRRVLADFKPDRVIMSFHGYPESYLREDGPGHCLKDAAQSCCDVVVDANRDCYLRQCKVTSARIQAALKDELAGMNVTNCYQSRLRDNWVRPFTDEVVIEAARSGVKKLLVFCPAFIADCLETLEEIEMRAGEDFREHGGDELRLVPSLNSSPAWAKAVVSLALRTTPALAAS